MNFAIHHKLQTGTKARDLFDGRLQAIGFNEKVSQTPAPFRALSDGVSDVEVWSNKNGDILHITIENPSSVSAARAVAASIAPFLGNAFQEYTQAEPGYWGFQSHAEWETAFEKIARLRSEDFMFEVFDFLEQGDDVFEGDPLGQDVAAIAKAILSEQPSLAEDAVNLMNEIESRYLTADERSLIPPPWAEYCSGCGEISMLRQIATPA